MNIAKLAAIIAVLGGIGAVVRANPLIIDCIDSNAIQQGCVTLNGHHLAFRTAAAECKHAAAAGQYLPAGNTTGGWHQLSIRTSAAFSDEQQAMALGFLEGWMTALQIHAHHHNMRAHFNLTSEEPLGWLEEQDRWSRQQASQNRGAFWEAMRLLHAQMDGMHAGYSARREHEQQLRDSSGGGGLPSLGRREFLFLSAVGDMDPLLQALAHKGSTDAHPSVSDRWSGLSPRELAAELHSAGRCSAVVRVTPGLEDLLLGHSAWFTFGAMVRVYKHYHLALHSAALPLRRLSFSSYPGELSSDDDFYLLDTGLAVLQTTNQVFNASLLSRLTPRSALSWQRARIASFVATSGRQWTDAIAQHNSGTGNNQWMVVDLKLFRPGQELPSGLLWVVEQMPGLVRAADQTSTLERGYWPSYNIPFDFEIYNASGYPEFIKDQAARGHAYHEAAVSGASYQQAPRAQIFRRDVHSVQDLPSLKALLRSNNWPHEPYSGGTPLGALCGRGDLDPLHPRLAGCYDSKATNWRLALALEADAVVGPPSGSGMQPFSWSGAGRLAAQVQHLGQPDSFAYRFERMTPDVSRWRAAGQAEERSAWW